jgi:hypothetical protein
LGEVGVWGAAAQRRKKGQKVSLFISSPSSACRQELLVLNNIMSLPDYSWHFASVLHTERSPFFFSSFSEREMFK